MRCGIRTVGGNTRNAAAFVWAVLLSSGGLAQDGGWEESIQAAREALATERFDAAARILRRAQSLASGFATDDPRRVVPLMELAKLHLRRGDYAVPEQLYRQADPIARQAWGADSTEYASLLNQIGRYYHLRVKYTEAERFYRLAFSIRTRHLGRSHPDVAAVVNNLAVLYENQVQYAKAETYYRTALDIRERALGPDDLSTVETLEHLARLLHKLSRPGDAAPLETRAREYRRTAASDPEAVDAAPPAAGSDAQSAVLMERSEPDYTNEARIANHEGSVLLQADVDADGRPSNLLVVRPLGLGLDEEAVKAVRQWKFRPARRGGQRVASRVRLEISFRLM